MSQKQVFFERNVKCGFFASNINFFQICIKINVRRPPPFFSSFFPPTHFVEQLVATNRRDAYVDSHLSRKAWAIVL